MFFSTKGNGGGGGGGGGDGDGGGSDGGVDAGGGRGWAGTNTNLSGAKSEKSSWGMPDLLFGASLYIYIFISFSTFV